MLAQNLISDKELMLYHDWHRAQRSYQMHRHQGTLRHDTRPNRFEQLIEATLHAK